MKKTMVKYQSDVHGDITVTRSSLVENSFVVRIGALNPSFCEIMEINPAVQKLFDIAVLEDPDYKEADAKSKSLFESAFKSNIRRDLMGLEEGSPTLDAVVRLSR